MSGRPNVSGLLACGWTCGWIVAGCAPFGTEVAPAADAGSGDAPATEAGGGGDAATPVDTCGARTLTFDGVAQHVTVPHAPDLDLDGPFTVEAWVRPSEEALPRELQIVSHHSHNAGQGWVLLIKNRKLELRTYHGVEPTSGNPRYRTAGGGANAYVEARWAHVAGSWDGTNLRVFYDGALVGTQSGSSNPRQRFPGDVHIGRAAYANGFHFGGEIDEVRLSKVARYTAAFARPTAPFGVDAGTLALYHFEETGGAAVVDETTAHPGALASDAPQRTTAVCVAER